ncbi:sterol desaturase family protein [Aurantiacibacter luteus]|uniref:Fatty acid hydroxylase n=1 Tax=Aurantiacibacter luteus TaxID=1581420 RepID=A0A0G9MXR3_9SPHN|nr:sterol desaturase family protein [Aurantiacibacter luteus]KLE34058.1 fatty acid hydroxylase [Aurantiacibacter luteus]
MDQAGASQGWIGMAMLAGVFAALALAELAVPFRRAAGTRGHRWATNLALFAIDTLAVRLVLPLAMVGTAALAAERGWGLFNVVAVPGWLAFAVTLLALDLALWLQHLATHRVPLLWRLHRVHHVDRDFDVTTAARFHPVEIVASMAWKMAVLAALGAPVLAVAVFETGFAMFTLWTHANVQLPLRAERLVRALIVTPGMHRIHHSVRPGETNSNYGTVLSAWDRLFGTYVGAARDEPRTMPIGLEEWRGESTRKLGWSLGFPFHRR